MKARLAGKPELSWARLLVCALVVLFVPPQAAPSAAQSKRREAAGATLPRVRVRRGRLVFVEGGRTHAVEVAAWVGAARIDAARVLLVSRRAGFVYLLLDVCGWSKSKSDDRQCGAGRECDLLWLRLDEDWRVRSNQGVRYDSCWLPVTSEEGYKVEGRVLRLDYEDFGKGISYRVRYDAEQPEKGLTIEESAAKPGASPR